jgi:hypothetical protein
MAAPFTKPRAAGWWNDAPTTVHQGDRPAVDVAPDVVQHRLPRSGEDVGETVEDDRPRGVRTTRNVFVFRVR